MQDLCDVQKDKCLTPYLGSGATNFFHDSALMPAQLLAFSIRREGGCNQYDCSQGAWEKTSNENSTCSPSYDFYQICSAHGRTKEVENVEKFARSDRGILRRG